MKRKILSLLLCFAMLFLLMPTMAFAAEDEEDTYLVTIKLVDIYGTGVDGAALTLSGTTINGAELDPYSWISTGENEEFQLIPGTYTLTETKAPTGYVEAENITFTVESDGTITINGETVPEVLSIYEKKPAANCTVTFDSKGGSSVASQIFSDATFGELPVPVRDGYQFDGWYIQDYQEQKSAELFYDGTVYAQILRLSNQEAAVSPNRGFADGNVIDFSVIFRGTKPVKLDLNDYYGFEDQYTINNNAIRGSIKFDGMQNDSGLGGDNWRTFIDIKTDITDTELDSAVGYEIQYFRVFQDSNAVVTAESSVPEESAMTLYAGWSKIVTCEHQWDEETVTSSVTCTESGAKTFTCTVCGETKTEEIDAPGHTEVVVEAVAATCTDTGLTACVYCSVCGEILVVQEEVPALGHTEVVDEVVEATCTDTGLTACVYCSVCGEILVAQEEVPALGHTEVVDEAVEATCTDTGLTAGSHCSVCDETLVAQEEVPALGHTEVVDEAVEATCTATGLTEGKHCTVCGEVLVAQTVTEKIAHTYSGNKCTVCGYTKPSSGGSSSGSSAPATYAVKASDSDHGSVTVSPKSASAGDTVKVTVNPDKGYTLETITVTDKNGKEVALAATEIGKAYTFKMPSGAVTVKATFMDDNTMLNYFVDVTASDYYYDAVLWASENGITDGVDAVHFAPNSTCTRAQAVTFLWRAAGCPEPESAGSFADVNADAYYTKAVAWAAEQGITGGATATTFSPNATCTRAQIMTFLYRFNGVDTMEIKDNPFTDVAEGLYYYDAVLWGAKNGITGGTTATTFSPDATCTRAQIVTFLYRFMNK